ncbi:UvrD-helicase domain-containing protein [Christiangramia aquimixticola]|uniref:UvrD-helicase domain-containing protein n=1 Tax=Christiangramia aquimixticola TaxID=1697558 RepID=UPI003AA89C0D
MNNFFHIYNASAGSGKTFTLVKEYLILLFNSSKNDRYKNILAITFTNKAVEELKKRIIKSLAEFSKEETTARDNPLMQAIISEASLTEAEIKLKSQEILQSIIHNYAAFEISTIDGFTHRVLRTFARDLGLPMNFEVELGAEDILAEAVDSLINRAGSDERLTKVLIDYTISKTDDDRSWDISRDLFEISRLLINENHQHPVSLLKSKTLDDFKDFSQRLTRDITSAEQTLISSAELFFDLLNTNGIDEADFSGKYIPKHFEKLRKGEKNVNFDAKWAQNIAEGDLYPKKAPESAKIAIKAIQPEIANLFESTKKLFFQIEYLIEIKKNIVQLSLINEINREIELIKKDRNLVLISEFNPKISAQVKDQPAPFIYERLGERYQHYFIDEFQDTSTMQWENLIPLIAHNLSQSQQQSGLTIVGDAKQSIYRWRGGRAEQLIDLSNLKQSPFQQQPKVVNLPGNYRSGSEVVNFNNGFFCFAANILTHPEYADLFAQSAQEPKKGDFGYVNVDFIEAKNRDEEMEIYPVKILETIRDLEDQGYSKQDICILTRRKKEGIVIAEYLSENSVSVISSETLLISQSPEVNLITNILSLTLNPEDDKIKLLIFDLLAERYLKEEETYEILKNSLSLNGKEFFNWLADYGIDFNFDQLQTLSLYEVAEYIIRSFDLVKDSNAYVQYFLDFVFETSQKSTNSLGDFMELWERKKDKMSIVVPDSDDAVQIMTIHKSKGLEFPVVIYPFANADLQNTRFDNLWLDIPDETIPLAYVSASRKMLNWNDEAAIKYEDLLSKNELDALNVLYVACTRAAEQLYIFTNYQEKPKPSPNVSDILMDYLRSIGKWDGSLSYEFGTKKKFIEKKSAMKAGTAPTKFYSSPVQNTAVNIVTRAGSMWDSKQQEAIERGEIAHEILARIDKKKDLSKALDWAITSGLITQESSEEISTLISGIIEHPELEKYYSETSVNMNEREILTSSGTRLRPDRLNFQGNKVSIIDYKTGGFVDTHTLQVSEYAQAIREMGYEVEQSLLVYTNDPLIIRNV